MLLTLDNALCISTLASCLISKRRILQYSYIQNILFQCKAVEFSFSKYRICTVVCWMCAQFVITLYISFKTYHIYVLIQENTFTHS